MLPEGGPGEPFREAIKGMAIEVDGMEMTLLEVAHLGDGPDGQGWYKGLGRVSVDYFGGAAFTASFDRIFINTDRQVVLGRIDFVTHGVAVMAEEQLAAQKDREQERIKEANREEWKETEFYGKIFLFDNIAIEDITVNGPNINVTDSEGNLHPNTEVAAILAANPEKAIVIEDKNGDQWVVEKDGDGAKVTKVDGGGLTSVNLASITSEEIDLVKKALKELRKEYTDAKLNEIEKELISKKQVVDEYIADNNAQYPKPLVGTEADNEEGYPELILIETPVEDAKFKDVVGEYKAHEYELNKAIVIKTFSKDTNSKTEYAIVASGVSINQKNLKEYLAEAAESNKPQDEQVQDIKGAILKFIEEILKNQVYGG